MKKTLLAVLVSAAFAPALAPAQVQQEQKTVPPGEGVPATPGTPGVDLRQVPGTTPGRNIQRAQQPLPRQEPFQAGSFLVYPEITLSTFYDSNVFYSPTDRVSDTALIVSPAVWVLSNWRQHALNFSAGGDFTRYRDESTEDTNDWRVTGEGRYDIDYDTNFYGGARAFRSHEDRESPDARNGTEPTIYYGQRYYGGAFRQQGPWSVRLGGTALWLNYDDVPFLAASGTTLTINNDDRDRWQYTAGVRVGYELSPRVEPFVQVSSDNRRYENKPDDLGNNKDSSGYRALAGVRYNVPNVLKLDAFGGYLRQRYVEDAFKDVSAPAFGAALAWRIADRWTLNAYLDRTVEETTVLNVNQATGAVTPASSFLNTFTGATLGYRFTDRLFGAVEASYSRADYQGIDRTDNYRGAGTSLTWRVAKMLYIQGLYQYRGLDSSIETENYAKNLVFLNFGIPISP
jgi:hypothetical protein